MRIQRKLLIDVGIFVAVGIGLVMVVVFFIGRERSLFEKRYSLVAPFEDISGLRMGAMVHLAGLNVGYVDGIRFPENGGKNLEVVLKINTDFQERIRKDSKATIQTQGLLGDRYVSITTGTPKEEILKDGEMIVTEGIGGVAALTKTGKDLMEDIREAAKKFQQTLDKFPIEHEDRRQVRDILVNLDKITSDLTIVSAKVRKGEGTIGAFLSDSAMYNDIRALLGHANRNKLLKNLIRATIAEQEKTTQKRPIEQN